MPVTYRDLPQDIDPIAFLFGDEQFTVPQSRLEPDLVVRLYERTIRSIDVKTLQSKTEDNPNGLQSLPKLLQKEPRGHLRWLKLEVKKDLIEASLPSGTPYQLQYLPLFGFNLPDWQMMPKRQYSVRNSFAHFTYFKQPFRPFEAVALLYGKNGKLYFCRARWRPCDRYESNSGPRHGKIYTFRLSKVVMREIEWDDAELLEQVQSGDWQDISKFLFALQNAMEGSAEILETRARRMRKSVNSLADLPIYYGR